VRVPVYLPLRCDHADGSTIEAKVVNLGTEGILIESSGPIIVGESLAVEFLLPDTLNSIRLAGEVVWSRTTEEGEAREKDFYLTGIKFVDLDELRRTLISDFTIRMLDNDELLREGGILRILDDLRNLSPEERLKAYHILIDRGAGRGF
jgi:hypothetical protein